MKYLPRSDRVEKMTDVGEDLFIGQMVEHAGVQPHIGLLRRFRTVGIRHTEPFEDGLFQICGTGRENAQKRHDHVGLHFLTVTGPLLPYINGIHTIH